MHQRYLGQFAPIGSQGYTLTVFNNPIRPAGHSPACLVTLKGRHKLALTQEEKQQILSDFGLHATDTGSTQAQVAMLTRRINQLIEHLKIHKHDQTSRRGLLKLVGQRRRMLAYLRHNQPDSYQNLIQRLGLRR
jgi:small subunit ribosomal protein S15